MTIMADENADSSALVAQARVGDHAAFGELCRLYGPRLVRQAMVLCGDATRAEDLAQDTLVAAWNSLPRYNGGCQFFTWLCAILIHLYQSSVRRRQSWLRWLVGSADPAVADRQLENIPDASAGPDQVALASERALLLRHCLERLRPKHREVVFLRFYLNESLEGIARALNCSVGTVKSRLFHGLEKLRQMKHLAQELHPDINDL